MVQRRRLVQDYRIDEMEPRYSGREEIAIALSKDIAPGHGTNRVPNDGAA